jgi:maltooligosyltrehalose synthase
MYLIRTLLHFRRQNPRIFAEGSYTPVTVAGEHAESVIAFERESQGVSLLVVVPRLTARVGTPPLGERWGDTMLHADGSRDWADLLTGRKSPRSTSLELGRILSEFPVAVLQSVG